MLLVKVIVQNESFPEPEQLPPFQPVNVELVSPPAFILTTEPVGKLRLHWLPQFIPDGEVTVPVPSPILRIVSVLFVGFVVTAFCVVWACCTGICVWVVVWVDVWVVLFWVELTLEPGATPPSDEPLARVEISLVVNARE